MSSLHKKSLIATLAIFCCRFTGLLREMCFTALFGASGAMDAFLSAFRVPNMLRDIFAEGALSQSFTSVMSKVEEQGGRYAAWTLANRVMSQLASLMLCVVALGVLLTGLLMNTLYPEKAIVDLYAAPQALSQQIIYEGSSQNADGITELRFAAPIAQRGWVKKDAFDQLKAGESLRFDEGRLHVGEKAYRVEDQNYKELAIQLCRIMWPFILLASISALCMGSLNVFGIFGLPNLSSAAFNVGIIVSGSLFGWMIDPNFGVRSLYGFSIAVVIGGLMQLAMMLPKMCSLGFIPRFDIGLCRVDGKLQFATPEVKKVWKLMIPGAIAAGIIQLNIFINTSFALFLPAGSVTALSMAFHLWQLPVALFGVAMGMVILPTVSRLAEKKGEVANQLAIGMRFVAFFALPSAVVLGIWGEQIVSVFFQRGRFDAQSSAITGQVLSAYSIGLLGYAGMKVLQPVFLALERPWAPAFLSLGSCLVSVTLNYCFVHVFGMGVTWLALTTAVMTTLNFAFYFFFLRRILGTMACGVLLPGILRIAGAGAGLALCCWVLREYVMGDFCNWGFFARTGLLSALGLVVGGVYLMLCYLFRVAELRSFMTRFKARG